MMIGILDPALLLPRAGEEDRLEAEIDTINQICRDGQVAHAGAGPPAYDV